MALCCWPAADAAPPAIASTEINYLLGFIERSGCQFYRNGSWYDSTQARAHLREKYEFLAAKGVIQSAEDFIERAATRSSLSGKAYSIKCGSAPVVPTNQWLREALAGYRASAGLSMSPRPDVPRRAAGAKMAVRDQTEYLEHHGGADQGGISGLIVRRGNFYDITADEVQSA